MPFCLCVQLLYIASVVVVVVVFVVVVRFVVPFKDVMWDSRLFFVFVHSHCYCWCLSLLLLFFFTRYFHTHCSTGQRLATGRTLTYTIHIKQFSHWEIRWLILHSSVIVYATHLCSANVLACVHVEYRPRLCTCVYLCVIACIECQSVLNKQDVVAVYSSQPPYQTNFYVFYSFIRPFVRSFNSIYQSWIINFLSAK